MVSLTKFEGKIILNTNKYEKKKSVLKEVTSVVAANTYLGVESVDVSLASWLALRGDFATSFLL